jgi:hypothetical protein
MRTIASFSTCTLAPTLVNAALFMLAVLGIGIAIDCYAEALR